MIAIDASNSVLQVAEATATPGVPGFGFAMTGLPVNQDLTLYVVRDGGVYPMVFTANSVAKDAFQLKTGANFNLGSIYHVQGAGAVNPTNPPLSGLVAPSTAAKRDTQPLRKIHETLLNNAGTLEVPVLVQLAMTALDNGWITGANVLLAKADAQEATTPDANMDKVHVLHALSRVAAMMTTTYQSSSVAVTNYVGSTVTLGDLLNGFGCTKRHTGIGSMDCSLISATSPTGADVSGWLNAALIPEVTAALKMLNEDVASTMAPFMLKLPGDNTETEIDYSDVLVFRGGLEFLLGQLYLNQAYDWTIDIDAALKLTTEQMLKDYTSFGTLSASATNNLTAAKTHLTAAADRLLEAMTAIAAETDPQDNDLITLNAAEIADAKKYLNEFKSSLAGNTLIDGGTEGTLHLNLAKLFDGIAVRDILPPFMGSKPGGKFPDATMGGIFPDSVYNFSQQSLNLDANNNGIPDILEHNNSNNSGTSALTVSSSQLNLTVGGAPGSIIVNGGVPGYTFDPGANTATISVTPMNSGASVSCTATGMATLLVKDNAAHSVSVTVNCTASTNTSTFTVPQMAIQVDGSVADWTGVQPALRDPSGDQKGTYTGLDILAVYLARDADKGYLRLDRTSTNLPANEYSNYWIGFKPAQTGGKAFAIELFHDETGVHGRLYDATTNPDDPTTFVKLNDNLTVNNATTSIEVAWPLSQITLTANYQLGFFTHHTVSKVWQENGDDANNSVTVSFAGGTSGGTALTVNKTQLDLSVGGAAGSITVSGGAPGYTFDPGAFTATISVIPNTSGTEASVSCTAAGTATLQVKDNAAHSVPVTVNCTAANTNTNPPVLNPMNMTVGGTRTLVIGNITTVPAVTVSDSAILTLGGSGTAQSVTCAKAGTATVHVTVGTDHAMADVNCVEPAAALTSWDITQWLFPTNVTLISRTRWQSTATTAMPTPVTENAMRQSRVVTDVNFADRGNVSQEISDDNENFFSFSANGLVFHGETNFDLGRGQVKRTINYGFKNLPDLTAGVKSTDLASDNLTPPPAIVPLSLQSGYSNSMVTARFALNSQNLPNPDKWSVTKTEITVMGNVNLLAAAAPSELASDEYFAHWRDSITDADLLSKATSVIHIKINETRFDQLGSNVGATQTNHIYLAQGLGTVYERNSESDGMWKSNLTAIDNANGLKSLTSDQVKKRQVRIDGPAGGVLKDAFVQTRGDHTTGTFVASPHTHNATGRLNETPDTSSALFTLYNRLNPPAWDAVAKLDVSYGAAGFVVKHVDVDTATMGDPQVLTLTADDKGQNVGFSVVTKAGTPVKDANVQVMNSLNGTCAQTTNMGSNYFNVEDDGKAAVVLKEGSYCLGVWPNNSTGGSFVGGWYDSQVAAGEVNISGTNVIGNAGFQVSTTGAQLVLVVGGSGGGGGGQTYKITGTLTDGTNGLNPADILIYAAGIQTPQVFHTGTNGDFSIDLPAGSYTVAFKYVGTGYVAMGYLESVVGTVVGLSRTHGVAQTLQGDLSLGTVKLTSEFNQTNSGGGDTGTVLVTGKVVDDANQPVKDVQVEMQPDLEESATGQWANGVTDASGNYSISVKKNGVYRVNFNTNYWNWQTQKQIKLTLLGGFSTGATDNQVNGSFDSAKKYTFSADTTVNAKLIAGLNIHGKVTSDGTTGVKDILVRFQPEWDEDTGSSGSWGEARTDDSGQYSFSAQPGKYRIEFATSYWKWDVNPPVEVKRTDGLMGGFADGQGNLVHDWSSANLFKVNASLELNAKLAAGVSLSGKVLMGASTVVKGAEVSIHNKDWTTNFHVKSGDDGSFSVLVVPGVEYRVDVWPAYCGETQQGTQTTPSGCGNDRVDFQGGSWITPPEASWVMSGWVKADPNTRPVVKASTVSDTDVLVYNNVSGHVAGVVPGMVMSQWDDHFVTSIKMDKSLKIGVVVDAGKPIQGRVVDATDQGVPYAWVNSSFGGVSADQNGYFTFNVPTSSVTQSEDKTFDIHISRGGHVDTQSGAWMQSPDFMGGKVVSAGEGFTLSNDPNDKPVQFERDLTADVTGEVAWPQTDLGNSNKGLLVRVGGGVAITGTVKDGAGKGIANIWVNAWSQANEQGGGQATDSEGRYTILVKKPAADKTLWYEVNLWSDKYLSPEPMMARVQAKGVTGLYERSKEKTIEGEDGSFRPAPGKVIQENVDGGVLVDFTLTTGNTISGRVTDESNNGLAWTWVDIHTRDGGKWYGANTDENGYYRVTVAPASNYVAVVWGWSGKFRTTFYQGASREDDAKPIDASGTKSPENVDILVKSGAKISGTIANLGKDVKVSLNVWSANEGSWGGTEVTGTGTGAVSFQVTGLAPAGDYRLDWHSDTETVPSGYYGGVAGGSAAGPKNWEKATLLSTLNGDVSGVAIDLGAVTTKSLKIKVTGNGIATGTKVDANVWSEKLNSGRWKQVTAGATGAEIELKGLDASGDDYRLFIGGPDATFKTGNFKGDVSGSGYPATSGTLVGWDRATMINLSSDQYVAVNVDSGRKVTVTVTGLQTGQKAWVDAFSQTTWSWAGGEVSADATSVELKGLEAAEDYRISIWGAQIQGGSYVGEGLEPGSWDNAALVDVSKGNATASMKVAVGKSISGTVNGLKKDQLGWVDAWSNSTYAWGGSSVQAGGTGADAYAIAGLKSAGDYRVNFTAEGYVSQKVENVSTTAGDKTGVDFTVSTGGSIAGTITGLKGYEWVRVDAWSPESGGFIVSGATADANGSASYTLSGVPAATDYAVGVWRGAQGVFYATGGATPIWDNHSKVSVSGTSAVTGIDLNLAAVANQFFTLSGAVSGLSADQVVEIHAWSATGGGWTSVTGNATYTLEGLTAGNYTVEVSSNGYVPQRTKSVTVTANAVSAVTWTSGWNDAGTVAVNGNTTGLDIKLTSGYTIKGSVTSGGNALSGAWVNAWSESNAVGGGGVTNAKGEFVIKGLPNGSYKVDVWTPDGVAKTTVTVTDGDPASVTLAVKKEAGIIKGTVTSGGAAAIGAWVIAYDSTGAEKDRAVTDSTGGYKLDGLELQSYTVKAFSADKAKAGDWVASGGYATSSGAATADGATLDLALQ
ncbi:MAG: carboxypeptidase regulatory-like domain-containing protein [Magnetococcales bacterium]|nr:carboxypeptidase regulatory-like domain-containing protein [Magnetococcales bacterium]